MSGRAKRIVYEVCVSVFGLFAVAGTVLVGFFGVVQDANQMLGCSIALVVFGLFCIFLPVSTLIHECGHLLFGTVSGLQFVSVSVGRFRISRNGIRYVGKQGFSGETQMLPRSGKRVRLKTAFFALGGAIFNLVFGGVFIALFFVVPIHPVLFFFELCAPLNLLEGVAALLPAELDTGRTDGKVFSEIVADSDYSKVFLAVLTAQGILLRKSFQNIPQELLFNLPVIREDETAFLALTQLRWQYSFMNQDESGAIEQIKRLESIGDYCPDTLTRAEIECEFAYVHCVLFSDNQLAETHLQEAALAKETCQYHMAVYAVNGEGENELRSAIEKEKSAGMKELYTAQYDRARRQKKFCHKAE